MRSLSAGTIETHLVHYVKSRAPNVFGLITREKFEQIKEAVQKATEPG